VPGRCWHYRCSYDYKWCNKIVIHWIAHVNQNQENSLAF